MASLRASIEACSASASELRLGLVHLQPSAAAPRYKVMLVHGAAWSWIVRAADHMHLRCILHGA